MLAGHPSAGAPAPGLVLAVYAQRCEVWWKGHRWDCIVGGGLLREGGLVVGDHVEIAPQGDRRARVERLHPRRNELRRMKTGRGRQGRPKSQVLTANVDQLVIAASVKEPPFRMGLVERLLVAANKAGLRPLIVITKLDLDVTGDYPALVESFAECSLRVIGTMLSRPQSLAPFAEALAGQVSVLVGHSGVGKSSLLNALLQTELSVGQVDHRYRRGQHTTTTARMLPLAGNGWVIDSPGIREFGLDEIPSADLAQYFPGFGPFLGGCAFDDCQHGQEAGCAIVRAVNAGKLACSWYDGYLKLLAELRHRSETVSRS